MTQLKQAFQQFLNKSRHGKGLSQTLSNELFEAFKAGVDFQKDLEYNELRWVQFLIPYTCPCGYSDNYSESEENCKNCGQFIIMECK